MEVGTVYAPLVVTVADGTGAGGELVATCRGTVAEALIGSPAEPGVALGEDGLARLQGVVGEELVVSVQSCAVLSSAEPATTHWVIEDAARAQIVKEDCAGVSYARMDALSPKWYGYTFNPHLAPLSLWKEVGGFSGFKTESATSGGHPESVGPRSLRIRSSPGVRCQPRGARRIAVHAESLRRLGKSRGHHGTDDAGAVGAGGAPRGARMPQTNKNT